MEVHAGPVNADGTEQVFSGLSAGEQVVRDALLVRSRSQEGVAGDSEAPVDFALRNRFLVLWLSGFCC